MRAETPTPFLLLLAIALPALALVAGLPAHPRILSALNNVAHFPVFGAFAIVVHGILERESRLGARSLRAVSFLLAVAAGVAIELVQPLIGRDRELQDVWTDALGAVAGIAIIELRRPGSHRVAGATLVATLAATAWPLVEAGLAYLERNRQAPALLDITSPFDWYFIWAHGLRTAQSQLPDTWRRHEDPTSVRLRLTKEPWRVISLTEPIADWQSYSRLMIDLTNPGPRLLCLTVRVHDRIHDNRRDDRFNRRFCVAAGVRTVVEIPVPEIATAPNSRRMELSRVAGLMLFAGGEPELAGYDFYVTRIWLEPTSP